jgi:hypothetical protein
VPSWIVVAGFSVSPISSTIFVARELHYLKHYAVPTTTDKSTLSTVLQNSFPFPWGLSTILKVFIAKKNMDFN